jgi:hypothetical protein
MLYIEFQENMLQNYKQDFRNEHYFNDKLTHGSTRNNTVAEVSQVKFTRICQTKTALINGTHEQSFDPETESDQNVYEQNPT